jgi:hypothetical protein
MALEMHPNDNAREGRPSVWIFSGQSVVLLVIGVGLSLVLFRVANALWKSSLDLVLLVASEFRRVKWEGGSAASSDV